MLHLQYGNSESLYTYFHAEVQAQTSSSCRTLSTDSLHEILTNNQNANKVLQNHYCMLSADESYIGSMLNKISADLKPENIHCK